MLVGAYPFEDPDEPRDYRKTIQRILSVKYAIPEDVRISPECCHLISRIFVADPATVKSSFSFILLLSLYKTIRKKTDNVLFVCCNRGLAYRRSKTMLGS